MGLKAQKTKPRKVEEVAPVALNKAMMVGKATGRAYIHHYGALTKLVLPHANIGDGSVCKKLVGLKKLDLSFNMITSLRYFEDCTQLRELNLEKNKVSGLEEIPHLGKMKQLQLLNLHGNRVSDHDNFVQVVLSTVPTVKNLKKVTKVTDRELPGRRVEKNLEKNKVSGLEEQLQDSGNSSTRGPSLSGRTSSVETPQETPRWPPEHETGLKLKMELSLTMLRKKIETKKITPSSARACHAPTMATDYNHGKGARPLVPRLCLPIQEVKVGIVSSRVEAIEQKSLQEKTHSHDKEKTARVFGWAPREENGPERKGEWLRKRREKARMERWEVEDIVGVSSAREMTWEQKVLQNVAQSMEDLTRLSSSRTTTPRSSRCIRLARILEKRRTLRFEDLT